MHYSDYVVYLWLIPAAFQIFIPLVILCGWAVAKLPTLLFGSRTSIGAAEPACAR